MSDLKSFFSFYGSKWRLAPKYPAPEYGTIIEPFAGSAGYSVRHADKNILLIERDPVIASVWEYLISASPADILALPHVEDGGSVDDYPELPAGARAFMGFWVNQAAAQPAKIMSKWSRDYPGPGRYGASVRARVAGQLHAVRHWQIMAGDDYTAAPDIEATWFIDPPYSDRGKHYKYGSKLINYTELADWCRSRRGQVLVCENEGADWLPFVPFSRQIGTTAHGIVRYSQEVIWTNDTRAMELAA